jgi:hypothetical protein
MRRACHGALLVVIALVATSCIDDATSSSGDPPIDDATVFTETAVHTAADGTLTVEQHSITAGEERAQNAARERAQAGGPQPLDVTVDPACAGTDFWLYATKDWTGDRLCLTAGPSHTGGIGLDQIDHPICWAPGECIHLTWANASGSYWAGVDKGMAGAVPIAHGSFTFDLGQKGTFEMQAPGRLSFVYFWGLGGN